QLRRFTANGPDLSYDFVTRAQCVHALLTADATLLRTAFRQMHLGHTAPGAFVHDLQNHDEITYQLVELDHRKDEKFTLGGRELIGQQVKEKVLEEMRSRV